MISSVVKYVIIKHEGHEYAITFSESLKHDVLKSLHPIRAGKAITSGTKMARCFGESITLGLKTDEDRDGALIEKMMGVNDAST